MQKKISIRSRLIGLLLFCWLLPLGLVVAFNFYYINSSHFDNKISRQIAQLKYNDQTSVERLNEIISLSRAMSYDGAIVSDYHSYEQGVLPKRKLLSLGTYSLTEKYNREEGIRAAVLWFKEEPEVMNCSTYNESVGGIYKQVYTYWKEDHKGIEAYAEELDTAAGFYCHDERLYLVRNVVDETYREVATLVFLLNQSYCFETYSAFSEGTSVTIDVNGCGQQVMGQWVTDRETGFEELGGSAGYVWENGILRIYHRMNAGDIRFKALVRFDDSSAFSPFYGYREILTGMIIFLIPLLYVLMRVFSRHVTRPVQKMLDGAEEIRKGNLGFQLDFQPESTEFGCLADAFNHMSEKLKYQFDHIYEEELALRDARIMALQSHLNPHFMNNTLEIINWEARLSGSGKVSQMIEALATLMDAGIDRRKEPEVTLCEEMVYVDAYLFIISERFGKRLQVVKEIPEEIMQYKVPRLILQPVIENAVEHGAAQREMRTITLSGYREGDYLYLEIVNKGKLGKKAEDKIQRLLEGDYDTSKESSGNMGIANVNQRLRILYGEPCGLVVEQTEGEYIRARLTILVNEDGKKIQ